MIPSLRRPAPLASVVLLALAACAGPDRIRQFPMRAGEEQVNLDAGFEKAQAAARAALVKTGFKVVEERAVEGDVWYVLGDLPAAMQSWGQFLRIVLVRKTPDVTLAVLHNERKIDGNVSEDLPAVRRKLAMNLQAALAEQP